MLLQADYSAGSFKIVVDGFNKKCTLSRQGTILEVRLILVVLVILYCWQRLSYLPLHGKVNLSQPDHTFHVLEDYGEDHNKAGSEPMRVFFTIMVRHIVYWPTQL